MWTEGRGTTGAAMGTGSGKAGTGGELRLEVLRLRVRPVIHREAAWLIGVLGVLGGLGGDLVSMAPVMLLERMLLLLLRVLLVLVLLLLLALL